MSNNNGHTGYRIMNLRQLLPREEIDYISLMSALSNYSKPRDKVRAMLHAGELIRVKKGIYVFGQKLAQKPYCKELLANLIYGPSCISLEYALSFYGLIPERVETITNITPKRNKIFDTPIGRFTYRYLHPNKYPIQIEQIYLDEQHPVLMASPEKALADTLIFTKGLIIVDEEQLLAYLFKDLRIDALQLKKMLIPRIRALAKAYQHQYSDLLLNYLEKIK